MKILSKKAITIISVILAIAILVGCFFIGKSLFWDDNDEPSKKKTQVVTIDRIIEDDSNDKLNNDAENSTEDSGDSDTDTDIDIDTDTDNDITSSDNDSTIQKQATKNFNITNVKGYYRLSLTQWHPGVVDMDAEYVFNVKDKLDESAKMSEIAIETDNEKVKVSGLSITVPYSVRNSGKPLKITVVNNKRPELSGSCDLNFLQFDETPTLVENFDSEETCVFQRYESEHGINNRAGVIEDGKLIYRMESEKDEGHFGRDTNGRFSQAYGCISGRIKVPQKILANAAFWTRTTGNNRYIKNPQRPSQSGGEIDIIEYFATWGGTKYATTMHWMGWSTYHRVEGIEPDTGMKLANEWHTYSVVWTKTGLYFYCDAMLTWAYEGEGAQAPKSDPMDLVLTLSTRGHEWDEWGGYAYPDSYPDEMVTDWVKCYQFKK